MCQNFTKEVCEKLGFYVYRLVDPRNGETFYVGKGQNNRVFKHVKEALRNDEEDAFSAKIKRIHEIKNAGLEVITIIHRHGMDEDTAFEVEAALIDAYSGLTNEQAGHGSIYSCKHTNEIVRDYGAEVADLSGFRDGLIIKIHQETIEERGSLYEAVRQSWRRSFDSVSGVRYAFAVIGGFIVGVFDVEKWTDAEVEGRIAFVGKENKELTEQFKNKRIPDEYSGKGMAQPVLNIK